MERRPTESEKFVNRVNGKEPAAWEELYARYYKALCAYSASLTGDAAFAEDLVQELLLRMWQSDRTFSVLPRTCGLSLPFGLPQFAGLQA